MNRIHVVVIRHADIIKINGARKKQEGFWVFHLVNINGKLRKLLDSYTSKSGCSHGSVPET